MIGSPLESFTTPVTCSWPDAAAAGAGLSTGRASVIDGEKSASAERATALTTMFFRLDFNSVFYIFLSFTVFFGIASESSLALCQCCCMKQNQVVLRLIFGLYNYGNW
jgi:hypothetical protein